MKKLFAEIKKTCRTKSQKLAFNELVKSFAETSDVFLNRDKEEIESYQELLKAVKSIPSKYYLTDQISSILYLKTYKLSTSKKHFPASLRTDEIIDDNDGSINKAALKKSGISIEDAVIIKFCNDMSFHDFNESGSRSGEAGPYLSYDDVRESLVEDLGESEVKKIGL